MTHKVFRKSTVNSLHCDICYEKSEENESLINMGCCNNTKNICIKCINCLTNPVCPYCRKKIDDKCIPYLNQDNNIFIFNSEPIDYYLNDYSWYDFLNEENIINPNLYDNSRRLRRQIRKLRYEYNEKKTNHRSRNRNNRRETNNMARNATNNYNENNDMEEIFFMD